MLLSFIWAPSSLTIPQSRMLLPSSQGSILADKHLSSGCFCPLCLASSSLPIPQFRMFVPSVLGSILIAKYLSSGCFCPHCWASSSLPNTSVQDASALTTWLHPHCQIPQFRMFLPSVLGSILTAKYLSSGCFCPHCWALSSLPNTSVLDASALHLGSLLTAKYLSSGCFCPHCRASSSLPNTSVQDASALTAWLHPYCQIPQFRMFLTSVLGSILIAKYLSSGCFCPHCLASSSLPNTSVQDVSALSAGLHSHCQIPQFRMLLPPLLGSILTAKYLSSGCFCPPSWLNPNCQYLSSGCFCPHCWASSSLPNTSVQDASALSAWLHPYCQIPQFRMFLTSVLGSILTAKYLNSGCFCPPSGLHPHCQISQFRNLLPSSLGSILTAKYLSSGCFCPYCWAPSILPKILSVLFSSCFVVMMYSYIH